MAKEKDKTIFEYKLQDGEEIFYKMQDGVVKFWVQNTQEWEDKVQALTSELSKLYATKPISKHIDSWVKRWYSI